MILILLLSRHNLIVPTDCACLVQQTSRLTSPARSTPKEAAESCFHIETLQKFFGYTVSNIKGKPTNSEFIAMIADCLSLRQKQGVR